jgi:hypothetical protein
VMYNILRSICGNYAGSRAFPASARNRRPCSATTLARHDSGANAVVCRLTASVEAMALKAGGSQTRPSPQVGSPPGIRCRMSHRPSEAFHE